MSNWYILNEDHTTKSASVEEYILWNKTYGKNRMKVKREKIKEKDCEVSTVFLGLDHAHGKNKKPLLFETMIFGGEKDGDMWRYETWEEAIKGHKDVVKKCGGKVKEEPDDPIDSRFDILDIREENE